MSPRHASRRALAYITAAALTLATGCRKAHNALLSGGSSSVSSITMSVPQIDTKSNGEYRIFASVLDQVGNPLTGFSLGNFSILENGGPGVPIEVSPVLDPLYVVLVIDRSGSMAGPGIAASNAAATALVNALTGSDYAALIEFDDTVRVTSGFTNDKSTLINDINAGAPGGATAIYDATVTGADLLQSVNGRRLLLVLTDGDDNSSSITLQDCIDKLNHRGLSATTVGLGSFINSAALQQIASQTGGSYAQSATGSDLTTIFLGILDKFNNLTSIRYRRREKGPIAIYLNYGDLTASATKALD